MIRQDPVLILMVPRSGSSMVAKIFSKHGLWLGDQRKTERWGYKTYENDLLNKALDRFLRKDDLGWAKLLSSSERSDLLTDFNNIVPNNTPWMLKAQIRSWRIVSHLFPKARFVFVKRDVKSLVESLTVVEDLPSIDIRKKTNQIIKTYRKMDCLSAERGIPTVNSDELIEGDFGSLSVAFQKCGMELDEEIAENAIENRMWHQRRN